MKKTISLILVLILAFPFILAGCGSATTSTPASSKTPNGNTQTSGNTQTAGATTDDPASPDVSASAGATGPATGSTATKQATATLPPATPIPTATGTPPTSTDQYQKVSYTQKADKTDYMYMYFRDIQNSGNVYIKSGRYGLSFDVGKAAVNRFGLCYNTAQADQISASQTIESMPAASSRFTLTYNGKNYTSFSGGGLDNYKLVRSGDVLQSFYIDKLTVADIPKLDIRMEVNASPNQVSVYYDLFSENDINNLGFTYRFNTGDADLDVAKWYNNDKNSGILTLSNKSGTKNMTFVAPLRSDGKRDKLTLVSNGIVEITTSGINVTGRSPSNVRNRTLAIGLLILPNLAQPDKAVHYTENALAGTEFFEAKGISPYNNKCTVKYDGMRGLYIVELRSTGFNNDFESSMLERISLILCNKYNYDIEALIMFTHKRSMIVWAVGSVGMIRDTAGNPTGLPVQLSKNWHTNDVPQVYDGQWQEYYVQLTLPAYKKVEYEFTVAGAKWGGVYSASHAQLCLIGWSKGMVSLWEECALTNYTETICYCPEDPNFTQDVRGIMFTPNGGAITGFNSNIGGGAFLYYVNSANRVVPLVDLKIRYYDLGPNLTYVKYCGVTADGKIRAEYTTRIQRSNDLCRIYHSFKYDILQAVGNAKVLAFYQYGTDQYNESAFTSFAYGNASGLTRLLNQSQLHQGSTTTAYQYVSGLTNIALTGEAPWLSWLGRHDNATDGFGHGDKALVVREWSATVGGVKTTHPYLEVRSANAHHQPQVPSNIMELGVGKKSLSAGDKISGTVEIMALPFSAQSYIGKDAQFAAAVKQYAGTWNFALYEAKGNDIKISGLKNLTLVSSHPTLLRAADGAQEMLFTVNNGISYVPVAIENIPTYSGWDLQEYTGGKWVSIRKSQEVIGNDYMQCRYSPDSNSYTLTYNVYRDARVSSGTQYRLVKVQS